MMLSMTLLSGCVGEDLLRPLCMKNWVQHFPQAGVMHPYLKRKIKNGYFNLPSSFFKTLKDIGTVYGVTGMTAFW